MSSVAHISLQVTGVKMDSASGRLTAPFLTGMQKTSLDLKFKSTCPHQGLISFLPLRLSIRWSMISSGSHAMQRREAISTGKRWIEGAYTQGRSDVGPRTYQKRKGFRSPGPLLSKAS
jgi:hypothetical protein